VDYTNKSYFVPHKNGTCCIKTVHADEIRKEKEPIRNQEKFQTKRIAHPLHLADVQFFSGLVKLYQDSEAAGSVNNDILVIPKGFIFFDFFCLFLCMCKLGNGRNIGLQLGERACRRRKQASERLDGRA
jgi:hypothetical protein